MNTQELYRQIQCRFANEVLKKVKQDRFGITTCKDSLTQAELNDLWCVRDLILISLTEGPSCCDINKLKQNINYL